MDHLKPLRCQVTRRLSSQWLLLSCDQGHLCSAILNIYIHIFTSVEPYYYQGITMDNMKLMDI